MWVDCAGAGYADEKREPDGSTRNPEMATRTVNEVLRLLSRGLAPSDLEVLRKSLIGVDAVAAKRELKTQSVRLWSQRADAREDAGARIFNPSRLPSTRRD